jgi:outer membrane lipoprotein SlyB
MKLGYIALTVALAVGFGATANNALAAGCLSGGAAGAVIGHVEGHHAVFGAIGGCIAGHEIAKHRKEAAEHQRAEMHAASY